MNRLPLSVALLGFSANMLVALSTARGQAPEPDPKALVQQASEFLQKQPAFSVHTEFFAKIESPAVNQESQTKFQVTLARPNQFAMVLEEGDNGISIYCNDAELLTYVPSANIYVVESAPKNTGEVFNTEAGQFLASQSAGGFLLCLIDPNPAEKLLQDVTSAKYVGREEIDGKPYHRCRFEEEQFDWDIWIAADGDPTIARIAPDMTKRLKSAGADAISDAKVDVRLTFSDWNFAPEIGDGTFTLTPPEGAEKLDSFFQQEEEQGPHPLLGKVAPPVNLENLDGKPVDLARHLGKEIVILDFWATWCGPCIAAMPEVNASAEKFADRGVALYFVNLQEDADTIRAFLTEQKLEVAVALDTEGAVAAEYGVTGIPQTVIIGKDGKVQVVHVGFSDSLQKQLTAELEGLLAGTDLAAEELAKYEKQADEEQKTDGPADTP
ncbi:MAG: DUF2092 domain-containing protein [Pirellulales bacterium]